MADGPVLVCEPQCFGYEHAAFNAALLRTAQLAFPESSLGFAAEPGHLQSVRSVWQRRGLDLAAVQWRTERIPPAGQQARWRLFADLAGCVRLLRRARSLRAGLVLLASVNATALIALKAVMPLCGRTPVLAIPHSCLAAIDKPWPRQPWRALIHMRGALALPSPARLRLVALGESILRHVRAAQPARRMSSWAVLDLPCLWPEPPAQARPAPNAGAVRFGFFGITNKGFGLFCGLADQVLPRYPGAQFVLVGFQDGAAPSGGWSSHIEVSARPLSDDEFGARAAGVTYSVWTGDPDHYRLTASASFLDALAYLTPVIALRNPFIEHCCQRLGDIGYLCGSREDLLRTVTQILACFPHDRYQRQQRNLLCGRALFDPTTLAPRLRDITAEARRGQ